MRIWWRWVRGGGGEFVGGGGGFVAAAASSSVVAASLSVELAFSYFHHLMHFLTLPPTCFRRNFFEC